MSFQSYTFLFALLPVSVAGWWLLNWRGHGRLAQGFLLVVSLAFYGKGNLAFLPLLLGSILFNFLVGKAMGALPRARKPLLVLGLLGNLGLLGYFKYANFFLDNLNWLLGTSIGALSLLLPLGISFFTFQQIAFLVDRYRGDPADYTLLEYACFVSFFPCVTSGPIAFHDEVIPQMRAVQGKGPSAQGIAEGLWLFSLGIWKKVIVAEAFGGGADWGWANLPALNSTTALAVTLSYTLQLYFDFSGYTDMARGIGKMLGVTLPENFDVPYQALTIRGFWKGWHMTMTRFFTRYLYIPLGGSRLDRLHPALSWALTFGYVNFCWIFFRAGSVREALAMCRAIARCAFGPLAEEFTTSFQMPEITWIGRYLEIDMARLALLMFLLFVVGSMFFCLQETPVARRKHRMTGRRGVLAGILLFWAVISLTGVSRFIYSNF